MEPQNDTPWWDKTADSDESAPWWDQPKETEDTPWWDTTASAAQTMTEEEPLQEQAAQPAGAGSKPLRLESGELNNTLRSTAHLIIHWCNQNIHTVIYTLIGLFCALGILKIGFWKTALLAIFIGGGFVIGSWHDGNPNLMQRIRGFSHRFLDNNPFMKDK